MIWSQFAEWIRRHPEAGANTISQRRAKLEKHLHCVVAEDHSTQESPSPFQPPPPANTAVPRSSASSTLPQPTEGHRSTAQRTSVSRRAADPDLLSLASCLSSSAKKSEAEACRDGGHNMSLFATWAARPKLITAGPEQIRVHFHVEPAGDPSAIFVARVQGPSTLLRADVAHKTGHLYCATFEPVESGLHRLYIRLEYAEREASMRKLGALPPAQYLGIPVPDSPFKIRVREDASLLVKKDLSWAGLPLCEEAGLRGVWLEADELQTANDSPTDLFRPAGVFRHCPRCTSGNRNLSTSPNICMPTKNPAMALLSKSTSPSNRTWPMYDAWVGRRASGGGICRVLPLLPHFSHSSPG
ncbi:hypothetical protein CYMTET_18788 [Cymbomonas tetramitiformis]|uniref:Uncharacterized protein n=1 Tax=Cymbomonas tetramitiformis TaxID=36881 RepID=A0AAE0G807_9CHLO|nr:hypothetical protein CYMTET_18788 [Cymbomonas tetramitiformis]